MALIRVSEKKLAANRANARRSRGPSTPEGKARSSRNACKHHLYAKTHQIPPAWQDRIHDVVARCAAEVEHPAERACLIHYVVLTQWIIELFAFETRLLNQSIATHRDEARAAHHLATTNPLFLAIQTRTCQLYRQAERAENELRRVRREIAHSQTTPNIIENKPLAMAAAAMGAHPNPRSSAFIRVPLQPQPDKLETNYGPFPPDLHPPQPPGTDPPAPGLPIPPVALHRPLPCRPHRRRHRHPHRSQYLLHRRQ